MNGLPKGWIETDFGSVFDFKGGSQPPKSEFISEFKSGYIRLLQIRDFSSDDKAVFIKSDSRWPTCEADDIMIGRYGASVGRILSGKTGSYNVALVKLEYPKAYIFRQWAFNFLKSDLFQKPLNLFSRSAQNGFNKADLQPIKVPLPPLAEQKRIVAKLDALATKSARARAELARIDPLVARYKQAVLSKAFSGELTKEWRLGKPNLLEWQILSLDQIISDGPSNGWSPKADGTLSGLKSLKLSATSSGILKLNVETIKYLDQTLPSSSKFWLSPDDILVQRANSLELLGTTVLFNGPANQYIYPDLMMRIRVNLEMATPQYVATFLNSDSARSYFRANATGTAGNMPKINGKVVRKTSIPLPPVEEQNEIVRRIESAFQKIDRLASEAKRALSLLGKLDEAILAKAFRGELVRQDENDEPAGVLLERIRAEVETGTRVEHRRGRKASES